VVRWPLQPLQPLQKTQLQPPFGPSVDSLYHPWVTATNPSYRFHIFETSTTTLRGTTGNRRSTSIGFLYLWNPIIPCFVQTHWNACWNASTCFMASCGKYLSRWAICDICSMALIDPFPSQKHWRNRCLVRKGCLEPVEFKKNVDACKKFQAWCWPSSWLYECQV